MWIFIDFTSLSRNRSLSRLRVPWCWIFGRLIFSYEKTRTGIFVWSGMECRQNVAPSHNESSLYDITAISHHLQVVLTNRNKIRQYFIVAKTQSNHMNHLSAHIHSAQSTHKPSFVYFFRIKRMASTFFRFGFFVRPQIECLKYQMLDGAVNWIYSFCFPLNHPHKMIQSGEVCRHLATKSGTSTRMPCVTKGATS